MYSMKVSHWNQRKEYRWTLKVWDKQGDEYETDAEKFETAILEDSEWKAEWIRGGNLLEKRVFSR